MCLLCWKITTLFLMWSVPSTAALWTEGCKEWISGSTGGTRVCSSILPARTLSWNAKPKRWFSHGAKNKDRTECSMRFHWCDCMFAVVSWRKWQDPAMRWQHLCVWWRTRQEWESCRNAEITDKRYRSRGVSREREFPTLLWRVITLYEGGRLVFLRCGDNKGRLY